MFSRTLILEKLELKAFQKSVGKNKKSTNLKKLDCLGYFSTRFTEITYFEVSEAEKRTKSLLHLPFLNEILKELETEEISREDNRAKQQFYASL